LIVILAVLFTTFSLSFFETTKIVPLLLRLSTGVYHGFLWQLATYPFVGYGSAGLWFLLELLILYWFGRDVYWRLGRHRFWKLLAWSAIGAAVVAVAVQALILAVGGASQTWAMFHIMQGQRVLMAIVIAAFATLNGEATILLFFVLPLKARWFLWLEILFAFIAFLSTKDFAGFCGICAAVGITYSILFPGGPRRALRNWRKQIERFILEQRLARMRKKRRFEVFDGNKGKDKWVH
jgi:hypothetical protein